MAAKKRPLRVTEMLHRELMSLLRTDIRDPRVTEVIVSRVEISDDLTQAKIYFRHAMGKSDEASRKEMTAGLTAASGRLRRGIGQAIQLRVVPELTFRYDDALDHANRIEEVLQEIKREGGSS